MPQQLMNRVALVTGAGSGIGAGIARAFAAEGAAVAVTDLRPREAEAVAGAIRADGGLSAAWGLDVCDCEAVERAADEAEERLGPLDVWVNNAGISIVVPFLECTEDVWDRTLAVNLKGMYLGCQAAIRRMKPRGRGVILNLSSQSGRSGNSHYAAYCASKFGAIGLTQSLAREFAADGLRVNALCPGVVFTPLWETMLDDYARKRNLKPEEVKPYLESRIPMGRLCTVEDVARAAVFLAGEDAAYITGQAIDVSGGAVM